MNTKLLCSILTLATGTLLAADSGPKDEVSKAARKLAEKDNYSYKASSDFGNFSSSTEGKTEKDGVVALKITFGDNTTEAFLKGGKGAVKRPDQDWQSLTDLEGEQGAGQFLVRRLQTYKAPAQQVEDLVSKSQSIKKEGDVYAGDLTEAGAKDVLTMGRRRGGNAAEPKNAKGSVKFWLKDGELSKYELKMSGTVSFGGDERDIEGTTTVEIKDAGKTKVEVPDAAMKKLS